MTQAFHDPIRHAYATLELEPSASLETVKRQYRALVRTWHPDRFTGNPFAIAEATHRLRAINHAYETIAASLDAPLQAHDSDARQLDRRADVATHETGDRLSREQIEDIVDAIRGSPDLDHTGGRWSRPLSLSIALIHEVIFFWIGGYRPSTLMPVHSAVAPLASIVFSLVATLSIWYGDQQQRFIGWFCLLTFDVVLPVTASMIIHYS